MSQDVYHRLAQRLDAIPNGFPPSESGVELRLLARIFAPEEAAVAAAMRLTREPAADIAARAGMDPDKAYAVLEDMAHRELIDSGQEGEERTFGLRPFVPGIYEAQLSRMDGEMAALFEQYYEETGGGLVRDMPPMHRVIPVGQAISFELEIFTYEQASELVKGAKSWGVRDCICRVQQRLVGKGCDRPIENCLGFAPIEGAFDHSEWDRAITQEEALQILREAGEAGLVHTLGNYRSGNSYICNCCTCCCGVLRGVAKVGIPTAVARSDFLAVVDAELCLGCGDCLGRCQFGALSIPGDVSTVDEARCVGCGLCTTVCPAGALRLQRRPGGEVPPPPISVGEWMSQRARERAISLSEIQ